MNIPLTRERFYDLVDDGIEATRYRLLSPYSWVTIWITDSIELNVFGDESWRIISGDQTATVTSSSWRDIKFID